METSTGARRARICTLLAYIVIMVFAILFVAKKKDIITQNLSMVSLRSLPLLFVASASHLVVNAMRFKFLLEVFNIHAPFVEWFGLTVSNTMLGYWVPARGGVAIRALYLKKKYSISFTAQVSLTTGASLICMVLASLAALLLLSLNMMIYGVWLSRMFYTVLVVFLLLLFIIALFSAARPAFFFRVRNRKLRKLTANFLRGLHCFRQNGKPVYKFAAAHIVSIVLFGLRLFLASRALQVPIRPLQALIIQALTDFSTVLSLTPGNLGVREGIIVFIATRFGIPAESALLSAALDRAVGLIVVLCFGMIFSNLLANRYARL